MQKNFDVHPDFGRLTDHTGSQRPLHMRANYEKKKVAHWKDFSPNAIRRSALTARLLLSERSQQFH